MELYQGALDVEAITNKWYKEVTTLNYGAFITFVGIIRAEDSIEALSFDIYKPILEKWFQSWEEEARKRGAIVKMAHAIGDVKVSESSFIAAIASRKRRAALELIDEFVEDFKANAPIWKYDIVGGKRIYAKERSTPMDGAGVLRGEEND